MVIEIFGYLIQRRRGLLRDCPWQKATECHHKGGGNS